MNYRLKIRPSCHVYVNFVVLETSKLSYDSLCLYESNVLYYLVFVLFVFLKFLYPNLQSNVLLLVGSKNDTNYPSTILFYNVNRMSLDLSVYE